jgi:Tfp pilus assembly protein PilN
MVRVNLLPRDIQDRRRFEKWYRYVFIAFFGLLFLALLVGAAFFISIQQKNDELQQLKEQVAKTQAQADAFSVFEQKATELEQRNAIAQTALSSRVNMGRLAEDVSLVLPDEVWLSKMDANQDTGFHASGITPNSTSHSMDVGFKSVAATLVRLTELHDDLYDVWLTSAAEATFTPTAVTNGRASAVVDFEVTAKVVRPPASTTSSGSSVPAPPSGTGQ